jgi:hypothetical protein
MVARETGMTQGSSLNRALPAIDVVVDIGGKPVKAIIPREVIERCLKGSSDPATWKAAYEKNATVVDDLVRRRFAARLQDFVVLRSSDFARASG